MSSLPHKIKRLLILAQKCWITDMKTFFYFAILHENQSLSQIFCEWLWILFFSHIYSVNGAQFLNIACSFVLSVAIAVELVPRSKTVISPSQVLPTTLVSHYFSTHYLSITHYFSIMVLKLILLFTWYAPCASSLTLIQIFDFDSWLLLLNRKFMTFSIFP